MVSIFVVVFSHSLDALGATLFLRLGSRRCTPKPPVLGVSTMDTGVVRAWATVAIQMTASAALQPLAILDGSETLPARAAVTTSQYGSLGSTSSTLGVFADVTIDFGCLTYELASVSQEASSLCVCDSI